MPVPVTLGKLCTSLSEMEIGDYIPCVYESTYKDESLTTSDSILNINGFFSQLGVKNPYISVTTNTVENGGEKVTTTEKEFYQELEINNFNSGTQNYNESWSGYRFKHYHGIFYLIKVGKGKLVADRNLTFSCFDGLNSLNYINGGLYQVTQARTRKVVDINITTKTYESTDRASDNTVYDGSHFHTNERYEVFTNTKVEVGNESTPTKTTVTTTTIYFAEVNEAKKPLVTAVNPVDPITLPYGADKDTIKAKLDTIPTVEATVLGTDGTSTSKTFNVVWDISTFNSEIDRQIIYGDLEDKENDPTDPISNTDGIRASVLVNIQFDTITSIENPSTATVKFGITQSDLKTYLQTQHPHVSCSVSHIINENGDTSVTNKDIDVVWDTSNFETRVMRSQVITGDLTNIPAGTINDRGLMPNITVDTNYRGRVESYELKSLTVENGVSNIDTQLGNTITATLVEDCFDASENQTSKVFNVRWDTSTFNNTTPGTQIINGTITDEGIDVYDFTAGQPTASVTVKPTIDSFETLQLSVKTGTYTDVDSLMTQLKTTIVANTTTIAGSGTTNVTVAWDRLEGFNGSANAGTSYTFTSTITSDISGFTNKAGTPRYTVTITA